MERYTKMDSDELLRRLKGHEWNDVEFKEAQYEVPKSVYETVSAFSNTRGGWLVFGVRGAPTGYEVVGVANVDQIQSDFLSALRADNKVNHDIHVQASLFEIDRKSLLVFRIPEAPRQHKPVYLNGDIRRTFIRRGGCDQRCTMAEIERFLRDGAEERWDGQIFDFPLDEAFDQKSLKWYRTRFNEVNLGHDETQPDKEFLYQWGYLLRHNGDLKPTRSAIMIFGSTTAIHHMLPRPTLDVQWIPAGIADPLPEMRWFDRVVYEENLIATWQGLVAKYHQYEPRPFRGIDPHTLMRDDTPAGYRVFREAAINLLTHQDYADHTRKAVIKFYRDVIQLWNPGDVFGSDEHLMEPGEKEVRNPRIVVAFRRLALCEQAGTGMRMMKTQWQTLGHPEPGYTNDRSRKAFEFRLPLKAESKTTQVTGQVSGEVTREVAGEVTGEVRRLLTCLRGEMTRRELQNALQLRGEENFRQKYLVPALAGGFVEMTVPDKPQSRLQKYRLTSKGRQCLQALRPEPNP